MMAVDNVLVSKVYVMNLKFLLFFSSLSLLKGGKEDFKMWIGTEIFVTFP